MIKFFIKKILPEKWFKTFINIKTSLFDGYAVKAYSQEGEDLILKRIFENKKNGFYVDIGAHHPKRFSNTYLFYKIGWVGLNVDAMPGSMKAFEKIRPKDINIEMGVGEREGEMEYYLFNEPALNGFSKSLSNQRHENESSFKIIAKKTVEVRKLSSIFEDYLPDNQFVDFLSIDAEGLDFTVLKSNDWRKYRPRFVLIEIIKSSLHDMLQSKIVQFMHNRRYNVYAKTVNTVFFLDMDYDEEVS